MNTDNAENAPNGSDAPGAAPGGFSLTFEEVTPTKILFKAALCGKLLHTHTFNPSNATPRTAFAKAVVKKAKTQGFALSQDLVEQAVMTVVEKLGPTPAKGNAESAYELVENPDDPEASGTFKITPDGPFRLTNITARIIEDVTVVDQVAGSRQFTVRTWLDGQETEFRITAEAFASNDKLKGDLFKWVGPKLQLFTRTLDEVRTAISSMSDGVIEKMVMTSHGWNGDGDGRLYLTTNGFVDADGFHAATDDDPVRLDLGGDEVANQLGLMQLTPEDLAKARKHIFNDFLKLHDRGVMYPILAAVALAVLMPFAGTQQRFVLWLKGLTGAGKSFVMKLASCFFGTFDPTPGAGQFPNWTWTANRIEKSGYFHRHALFLVDDFKPELANANTAVRVVQGFADGHGRGRLHADTSTAMVLPIQGQLVATGEDLPQHHASTLARTIVIDTPNRPKDLKRGRRCLEWRHCYAGVMADFLAHLLREGRLDAFAASVSSWTEFFYDPIAGRQNDSRIAANFGMLAAALHEFGAYLAPAWPSWEADIHAFIHNDLVAVRDAMVGHAESQQPSEIFVETLRQLLGAKTVRVRDWSEQREKDPRQLVGRLHRNERYVAISIGAALAEVQKSLRAQGRPDLAISEHTLLEQLCHGGALLDHKLKPMTSAHKGGKTFNRRIVAASSQIRVALFPMDVLLPEIESERCGHQSRF